MQQLPRNFLWVSGGLLLGLLIAGLGAIVVVLNGAPIILTLCILALFDLLIIVVGYIAIYRSASKQSK